MNQELPPISEPVLHSQLVEFITIIKEHDMRCGISTNMNQFPNMREVVKAKPDYLRISLSGYTNETYRQPHRRGDITAINFDGSVPLCCAVYGED